MTDVTYPLFPIFAFVGLILSLIPLPWHLQAWNSGTCYFMMWAALACLNQFVNSVLWAGNAENHSPIWCDISIRILMASSVALPASSLCINRRLYLIASARSLGFNHAAKRRAIIIDTLICVVFPLVFMACQYIVQGHRFNIFEDIGCYPALYNTLPTYFISAMWPIVIGVISATYCIFTLCAFYKKRLEFSRVMNSSSSPLTMGRYFRLMALAMTEILFTTPMAVFSIYLNTTISGISPWISWEDTHFEYFRMPQIPAFIWKRNHQLGTGMELTRWSAPLCAFIFFIFFGFADESRKNYRKAFRWASRRVIRPFKADSKPHGVRFSIGPVKSPFSSKTSSDAPSTLLPCYSPPALPSYVFDIKGPESSSEQHRASGCTTSSQTTDTIVPSALESKSPNAGGVHEHLPQQRILHDIFNDTILPSSRRHSSYF